MGKLVHLNEKIEAPETLLQFMYKIAKTLSQSKNCIKINKTRFDVVQIAEYVECRGLEFACLAI